MTVTTQNQNNQRAISLDNNDTVVSPENPATRKSDLIYAIDDTPPWGTSIVVGFQHYVIMAGSTIAFPIILCPLMCIPDGDVARGTILSTIFFVSGIITFLQTTFGVRLPIVQGPTYAVLLPTIVILTTSFSPCPSAAVSANMTSHEREELWQLRMREVQGAILIGSIIEVFIGFTGLIGLLLTWITPMVVVPTVTLLGLAFFEIAAERTSLNSGISFLTILLIIIFSQHLENIPILWPNYTKISGVGVTRLYIFKLCPILFATAIPWAICFILTSTNILPEDDKARTDITLDLINNSPWFRIPYPGQWGWPIISVTGVVGIIAGVIASVIESVGDYYACAKITGAPPPPIHAINRGIGIEGIGGIIAALWGTGNASTSFSQNIGAIGITKVGSRRIVQCSAAFMVLFGVLGKFAALFASIPEPIIGGVIVVMFAVITAVGLSPLQYIDLNSSRNQFVLGCSLFFGLFIPKWMSVNKAFIQTGYEEVDQIITILLETSILVGATVGLILDNTIPGTPEERGLVQWNASMTDTETEISDNAEREHEQHSNCYDFPFGMNVIRRLKWMKYIPFSPTFYGFRRRQPKRA